MHKEQQIQQQKSRNIEIRLKKKINILKKINLKKYIQLFLKLLADLKHFQWIRVGKKNDGRNMATLRPVTRHRQFEWQLKIKDGVGRGGEGDGSATATEAKHPARFYLSS